MVSCVFSMVFMKFGRLGGRLCYVKFLYGKYTYIEINLDHYKTSFIATKWKTLKFINKNYVIVTNHSFYKLAKLFKKIKMWHLSIWPISPTRQIDSSNPSWLLLKLACFIINGFKKLMVFLIPHFYIPHFN